MLVVHSTMNQLVSTSLKADISATKSPTNLDPTIRVIWVVINVLIMLSKLVPDQTSF